MANTDMPAPPSGYQVQKPPAPPEGFTIQYPQEEKKPGVVKRTFQRAMGTDVEDPLPWTRLSTTIAGAIGGGYAGAQVGLAGGAPGALAGGVAGAAAGAVAPEAMLELGETLGLLNPGTRERIGLSNEDLKTVLEGEMILEMATGGGVALARAGGRGVARLMTGAGAKKARGLAETAAREGINAMPVQVGSRKVARSFVSVLGRFPFIGSPVSKQGAKVEESMRAAFQNLPSRIAVPASMTDVSAEIMTDVLDLAKSINTHFGGEYEKIFKQADSMGITIKPQGTLTRAQEILDTIAKESPKAAAGQPAPVPPQSLVDLRKFISRSILPMKGEGDVLAGQSLRQMDTLMEGIDDRIALVMSSDKGSKLPLRYLEQLRNAVHMDMMQLGRGQFGRGGIAPAQVGASLRKLDERFSHTLSDLFETATAKRFGSVRRHGIRGMTYSNATTIPVDTLADVLMRGDSPQIVTDLQKITRPETFNRLASSVLDRRIGTAMKEGVTGTVFNVDNFAKSMGIGNKNSPRYLQSQKMLQLAGGLSMPELEKLVEVGRAIGSTEIPNVSSFVARRAVMGGARSLITSLTPGAAFVAGGAAAQGWSGAIIGGVAFVGGGRLMSHVIANPDSARALRFVLKSETSRAVKRAAGLRAIRVGIWSMEEAGTILHEEAVKMQEAADVYFEELQTQQDQSGPTR